MRSSLETFWPVSFEVLPDVLRVAQPGDWGITTDATEGYLPLALPSAFMCVGESVVGCTANMS